MVSARFFLQDNLRRVRFFEEIFLLADISKEMVLGMLFLFFSNVDIKFSKQPEKLIWRSYIVIEILPITRWVKLINEKIFAKAALDGDSETFVVYVIFLEASNIVGRAIHLS